MTLEQKLRKLIDEANERMEHAIKIGSDGAKMDAGGIVAYGKALTLAEEAKEELNVWINKNSTIPLKDIIKDWKGSPTMHLATLDGGWVNGLKLHDKLEEVLGFKPVSKDRK